MKKLMSLAALAVVGSVVAASAQEVLSANAVGYVKRTIPAGGKFQIVSVPFVNLGSDDGSYKFSDTQIAEDLPLLSEVMFWDDTAQSWITGRKTGKGWTGLPTEPIKAGEAFFIKSPEASEEPIEVTAAGEVPDDTTLTRSYVGGGEAFSTASQPYPVDVMFGDTELATTLPLLSEVMFWDVDGQSWVTARKTGKGWQGVPDTPIQAGEGFFIKSSGAAGRWDAVKPYTWP